jgi:hypothetical protein
MGFTISYNFSIEPFPKPLLLEDEVLERPQGGKTNNSTE